MPDQFKKSLNTLELPAVLSMLAAQAVSESAKEAAALLYPSSEAREVSLRLAETSAAKQMMVLRGSPSFSGLKDIRPSLSRAALGGVLNTRELLDIAKVLQCARLVRSYIADDSTGKTTIDHLFYALRTNKYLEERIFTSIPAEDEIADSASSDLADIRRKMRAKAAQARDAIQKIISSPSYAKALQEPIITIRSDRYVVPVRADHKSAVPGLVHDISASGMTLFIEPMAAVKANNELRELAAKEKLEIERILSEFSADCAEHGEDIGFDFDLLVKLDLIFAKAKLSYKLDCSEAAISERSLTLCHARHPLLDQAKAVPIDVTLGTGFDTLVITGPNTGGKTVCLKTIGLLAAMHQCGLHIPAADGSELPVFRRILADIGDEQSIEQNLSTFSAHMSNIVNILSECDDDSLLLFDELGAGTDPVEGAALAIAVIEHARKKEAVIAATTHYAELKVYATNEPGVQNASCEFDVETLRPTYRLLIGIPGKSNAFAISRRLGLPEEIIIDAQGRIAASDAGFESTIEKLELFRHQLEKEKNELDARLRKAEEDTKKISAMKAELEVRLEKAEIKAKREAERILADARNTAEETFHELDEMRREINSQQEVSEINAARSELRRKLNAASESIRTSQEITLPEPSGPSRPVREGDIVRLRSLGLKAEVKAVSPERVLTLSAGSMNLTAREEDVILLEETGGKKSSPAASGTALRSGPVSDEIDLRGMDSIEAVLAAERFIDGAVMAKLGTIRLIHGKGTGVLRDAVRQMLKTNKSVRSFRPGRYGEGENGVTIVELK